METEKISDIFLHLYLSNITTSGHINISVKLHSSRQCLCSHRCLSVLCGPVSLPVVVHGSRIVERLPDHLQQSSPARLPPTRGHGGQHGEQPRREGHGRCWDPHQRRSRPVQLQYRLVTHQYKTVFDWLFLPSLSPVLTTLMKNKVLVTPGPSGAQSEPKSLPSSSGETSAARVAPSEPSEDRPVRKLQFSH